MIMYFVLMTAHIQNRQREQLSSDAALKFETLNTELLTAFNAYASTQHSGALQTLAESSNMQEVYFNAIDAQNYLAEITLIGSSLDYYKIAAVSLDHDRNLVITPTETLSLTSYADQIGVSENDLLAQYKDLQERSYGYGQLFSKDKSGDIDTINYLSVKNYGTHALLFVLSIDNKNFTKVFDTLACPDWVILYQNLILASKNSDPDSYASIVNSIDQNAPALTSSPAPLNFKVNHNKILGASFSDIGWQFYAVYPSGLMSFYQLFFFFFLPLFALTLGMALLVRRMHTKLYAPIANLMDYFGGSPARSVNEFAYIQEQAAKISERAKKLDSNLSHSQLILAEQIYKNALLDSTFKYEDEYKGLSNQIYVTAKIENAEADSLNDQFSLAKKAVQNAVRMRSDCHYINDSENSFILVLNSTKTEDARMKIQELLSRLGISQKVQLRIALSAPVKGLENLHASAENCTALLEYRHRLPKQMFLTAETVAHIYYDSYFYPMNVESNLIAMTVNGTQGALVLLEQILHENLEEKCLSPTALKKFFFALLSTLNRIYQELHLEESDQYPSIEKLFACENPDLLLQEIRAVFARIIGNTSKTNMSIDKNIGKQMASFVHEKYSQDISLDDMAEELNLSPKYCSALFKNQIGQTFKKYLNEYRIERAKEKLSTNPDIKINDLATQVGFIGANTFIQVFKKYTGTTPHQYALQEQKNKSPQ